LAGVSASCCRSFITIAFHRFQYVQLIRFRTFLFVRLLFKKARRQIGGSLPIRLPRGDETLQSACPASGCLHGRIKHRIHPEALRPDADPARAPNSALRLFGKLFDPDANPIT